MSPVQADGCPTNSGASDAGGPGWRRTQIMDLNSSSESLALSRLDSSSLGTGGVLVTVVLGYASQEAWIRKEPRASVPSMARRRKPSLSLFKLVGRSPWLPPATSTGQSHLNDIGHWLAILL